MLERKLRKNDQPPLPPAAAIALLDFEIAPSLTPSSVGKLPSIPCCLCGVLITANSANQCSICLSQQFDLTSLLNPEDLCINRCRRCLRYQSSHNASRFEVVDAESAELLALCLKRIPAFGVHGAVSGIVSGVTNLKLVDANFVWTEPHSKRLKLKVTVRADLADSAVSFQQRVLVELRERNKQCVECERSFANQTWQAVVQLRQKREDNGKRGLLMVEHALAKSKEIRRLVINIEISRHGFDFYFG